MYPKKIIFVTRQDQVSFHVAMAAELSARFPDAPIVFLTFFSRAEYIAKSHGFESVNLAREIQEFGCAYLSEQDTLLSHFDEYCRVNGTSLWEMLDTERFLPKTSHEKRRFAAQHVHVLSRYIAEESVVISSFIDHFVYLCASMMTKWRSGFYFAFGACGIPSGRVAVTELPWSLHSSKPSGDESALLGKTRETLLLPAQQRITYMKKPSPRHGVSFFDHYKGFLKREKFESIDRKNKSYFARSPLYMRILKDRTRIISLNLRKRLQRRLWDITTLNQAINNQKPIVFMALHLEPEATVLMYSPKLKCQAYASRLVSQNIPYDFDLWIKENPKMAGRRPSAWYQALKELPNVKLVSPELDPAGFLHKVSAVVSLGGTITFEAALRGIPAFCLGRPPFSELACSSGIESTLKHLRELQHNSCSKKSEDQLIEAWNAWVTSTIPFEGEQRQFDHDLGALMYKVSSKNVQRQIAFIVRRIKESA